jgi:hypothetical protein
MGKFEFPEGEFILRAEGNFVRLPDQRVPQYMGKGNYDPTLDTLKLKLGSVEPVRTASRIDTDNPDLFLVARSLDDQQNCQNNVTYCGIQVVNASQHLPLGVFSENWIDHIIRDRVKR